jgi:mycofactocin glycosyltransferase
VTPDGVPAGTRLRLDPSARRLDGGRVLLGGLPLRLLRLTPAGAALVDAWARGEPVSGRTADRRLARRLLAAGLAHPRAERGASTPADVAVVVPVRDRPEELRACLGAVGRAGELLVVDDGSRDPAAVAAAARAYGARVVRRSEPRGPAAARNAGLRATGAELVAFVDSDCAPQPGWLERLLGHFDDPAVGAVAPRITGPVDGSALGRFEAARSPLDLGPRPSAVAPGLAVGYVPAAALVVRRAAAGSGFDEALRYGEDVDFVWRLARGCWAVRYEPAVRVEHRHRGELAAWLAQRASYGTSAAQLALRHPGAVSHLVLPAPSAALWALAASGRPRGALCVAAASTLWLARLPAAPGVRPHGAALLARVHWQAGRQLAEVALRVYAPLTLPLALRSRRARALLAVAAAAPALAEWCRRRPALDPLRYAALRALDDMAYAAGLWAGCLRARNTRPLVPRLAPTPHPSGRTSQGARSGR